MASIFHHGNVAAIRKPTLTPSLSPRARENVDAAEGANREVVINARVLVSFMRSASKHERPWDTIRAADDYPLALRERDGVRVGFRMTPRRRIPIVADNVPVLFAFLFFTTRNLLGADLSTDQEIPALKPPRAPLPPGFWELYGGWVIALSAVVLIALVFAILRWLRPKPPVIVPPAVEARVALGTLRNAAENGPVLSRVSQIVRRYFGMSFGLPPAELTTAEFSRAMVSCGQMSPELRQGVTEFLRECDERKFAPSAPATPLRAVDRAEQFIEAAEARRQEIEMAAAQAKAVAGNSK